MVILANCKAQGETCFAMAIILDKKKKIAPLTNLLPDSYWAVICRARESNVVASVLPSDLKKLWKAGRGEAKPNTQKIKNKKIGKDIFVQYSREGGMFVQGFVGVQWAHCEILNLGMVLGGGSTETAALPQIL